MNPKLKELNPTQLKEEYELCTKYNKYFYNNYCRAEGMPEYSEEVFEKYTEDVKEKRSKSNLLDIKKSYATYPLSIDEVIKSKF